MNFCVFVFKFTMDLVCDWPFDYLICMCILHCITALVSIHVFNFCHLHFKIDTLFYLTWYIFIMHTLISLDTSFALKNAGPLNYYAFSNFLIWFVQLTFGGWQFELDYKAIFVYKTFILGILIVVHRLSLKKKIYL